MKKTQRASNFKIQLMLLALLFMAPGLLAYVLFSHPNWLAAASINKGKLLKPAILVAELAKIAKWQIILWNPAPCAKGCLEDLDQIARIRLALGRHLYELKVELLQKNPVQLSETLRMQLKDADIQTIGLKKVKNPLKWAQNRQVFLANPEGYLVLSYPLPLNPAHVYQDLKRLLNIKEQ